MGLRSLLPGRQPLRTPEEERREAQALAAAARPEPTPDEQTAVRIVRERFEIASRARAAHHRRWALSLAFFRGHHYVSWEPITQTLVDTVIGEDVPTWRELVKDNVLTNMIVTAVSRWERAKPVTVAVPNNPRDPLDIAAADAATKALRHIDRVTQKDRKRRKANLLRAIYGTAVLCPYWDSSRRTEVAIVDPATGLVRARSAWAGEIDFDVYSVWEIFPQPADAWDRVQWCIKARRQTLDWIRENFPERGALVREESAEGELFQLAVAHELGAPQDRQQNEPSARVLEYYERPSRRYPSGRYIITAGDVLLWYEERLPHPKGRFPVIPIFGVQDPESLWGQGLIDQVIAQQQHLNSVETQIAEDIADTARPKYQVAREAEVDEEAFHRGRGEVVEWSARAGAPPPGPIVTPQLPSPVYSYPEQIIDRMQRVVGINEITAEGRVPAGVKSGIAIELLQQQDDTRLALMNNDAADAWRELDQQMLEWIADERDGWTVPRFVRVLGEGEGDAAVALMATDLRGNTEVALENTEGISDSIATKRQRYLDYFGAQMLPPDPELLVDLFRAMQEHELAEILTRHAQRQAERLAAQQTALLAQAMQGAGPVAAGPGFGRAAGTGAGPAGGAME